jgi:ketosteroid isomerase-like protein
MKLKWCSVVLVVVVLTSVSVVRAAPEDEVRAVIDRYVAAQNAHDLGTVAELLWDSPEFLWITRGAPIWGRQPALTRFEVLYRGTWRLEPALSDLRIMLIADGVAQTYLPIMFTIGPPGEQGQKTRFLVNQVLLKTPTGWKVSSILPIPVPTQ